MDYDELFETLDELLSTINGAVEDEMEIDSTGTAVPYFTYMFDKMTDVYEDMETEDFPLSPMH